MRAMDVLRRNNVKVSGSGPPMVLLHGFGCDQLMWRFLAPELEHAYTTILLDYVGQGGSDKSAFDEKKYSTLQGYADDLVEVCDALNLRDAILVGHSVSSMVALLASFKIQSRLSRLIFVCPSPCYLNKPGYRGGLEKEQADQLMALMDQNYAQWANVISAQAIADPAKPEHQREFAGGLCSLEPRVAKTFARATFYSDHREDLAKCRVPSLLLQCDPDALAPPEVGRYMARRMPRSVLRVLHVPGHSPHLTAPDLTLAAIDEYLRVQV